jgi:acyl carrier protein
MSNADIIKNFIVNDILTDAAKTNINYEDSLLEAGVIDSLGIMKMLAFLSDEFQITVEDEEVIPENFETINAISSYIEKKKSIN